MDNLLDLAGGNPRQWERRARALELMSEDFDSLQPHEKRVRLAVEALAAMELGVVHPVQTQYLVVPWDATNRRDGHATFGLEEAVRLKECKACLIGGMFVAGLRARLGTPLATASYFHPHWGEGEAALVGRQMFTYLSQWFDTDTLAHMEAAYEMDVGFSPYREGAGFDDRAKRAANFWRTVPPTKPVPAGMHEYVPTPEELARAILYNVIDNDGAFCP